jgi:carbon-monoxide dehydrogenase large subunit
LDISAALDEPEVLAVYTGQDIERRGLGKLHPRVSVTSRDGSDMDYPPRPLMAADEVRYAGEVIAMVVATSLEAARDAADLIMFELEELPAIVDVKGATHCCFEWEDGNSEAVEAAFKSAQHVTRIELPVNRVSVTPIETRGAIGCHDSQTQNFTLYTQSQGVHGLQSSFAEQVFKIPKPQLRVITGDVGGSFGMKIMAYPEQGLVLFAARELGRPVKWVGDRADAFLTDNHARDHYTISEVAMDEAGRFLAFRTEVRANLGAYLSSAAPMVPTTGLSRVYGHVYDVPALYVRVYGMLTNTTPIDAYRGAGKPEMIYVSERLVDLAAVEMNLDPIEIRRRNLVPPEAMPYTTGVGKVWDCGHFEAVMDRALELSEWAEFETRKQVSERNGKLRGIGICMALHATGGNTAEMARVLLQPQGYLEVHSGTQSSGQGHETSYAHIVAERFGVTADRVKVVQGDTGILECGGGTGGSSSMTVAMPTIHRAANDCLDKAHELAAQSLECARVDIEYGEGQFRITGTDRTIGLFELPVAASTEQEISNCMGEALYEGENMTSPNGAYITEVEVDPETGGVRLENVTIVNDLGRVLNAQFAEGQIQGGVAQALGQAMMEEVRYDPQSGQLLSGSLMDYGIPRADDLPMLNTHRCDIPSLNNPHGYKGAGEIGAIGGCAAYINAVINALGTAIDMPATPLRVWKALNEAKK